MMHAAEHDRFRPKIERAVLFRYDLLLAMLVARPLRRANITAVEIGGHLQRRGEHWRLCFTGAEMKSHRPYECSVPEELTSHVNRYIDVHRPILLQCSRSLGADHGVMDIEAGHAHDLIGCCLSDQGANHIYATDNTTLTPSTAGSIKLGLGHACQKIGEAYYNLS